MQSFNTENDEAAQPDRERKLVTIGPVGSVPPGRVATVELPESQELALYNVNGEFYATQNFCPHKGAPLAEGRLCEHIIECEWHGWQFDVRTGECFTAGESLECYRVIVEDGMIKVEV
jgi:nitrite reductase/ring-hydroxylating ferredoxin subunit